MSHNNKIIDKDPCFEVDAITRVIRNVSNTKTTVMQFDHNSERFSFTLPRFVEGHDLMESTKAEVHYNNVDTPGVYTIEDLTLLEDEGKVKCSWLISSNATFKVGALDFLLRFSCLAEDGSVVYVWNTGIYKGITVSKGMCNTEIILEQNPDALEQMKETIKNYVDEKIGEGGSATETDFYNGLDVTPTEIDLLSVYILNDGTASISYGDYPGNYSVDELVIPYEVEYEGQTYPVSTIGNSAFWEARINKLVIPNTVKLIEDSAFYQSGVKEIVFCGDNVVIKTAAFEGHMASSIELPKNVKFYDENSSTVNYTGVFSNSPSLKTIEFPEGSIRNFDMVGMCPALEKVNIPKGTKGISAVAFYGCTSLKEISIPKEVQSIQMSAFLDSGIKTVYYEGTKEKFNSILKDDVGGESIFDGVSFYFDYTDGSGLTPEYVDEKIAEVESKVQSLSGVGSLIYYGNANIVPSANIVFYCTDLNNEEGTACISTEDFPGDLSGEMIVPYEVEFEGRTYKIVGVGNSGLAYLGCTSLILPSSIKYLDSVSFWQAQVKEITFCGDTFEIKEEAFMDCAYLTDIYYRGRESDWNKKVKGKENIPSSATIHFLGI